MAHAFMSRVIWISPKGILTFSQRFTTLPNIVTLLPSAWKRLGPFPSFGLLGCGTPAGSSSSELPRAVSNEIWRSRTVSGDGAGSAEGRGRILPKEVLRKMPPDGGVGGLSVCAAASVASRLGRARRDDDDAKPSEAYTEGEPLE